MQNSTTVNTLTIHGTVKKNIGALGVGEVKIFPHDSLIGGRAAIRKAIENPLIESDHD